MAENLAWQIGSNKPPTVCLCCGTRFDDLQHKRRGPYLSGPYIWVCQWCWEKEYLFFPDKENEFPFQTFTNEIQERTLAEKQTLLNQKLPMRLATGKELQCDLRAVSLSDIRLDQKNVRLKHIVSTLTQDDIEAEIWNHPSTRALFRSIEATKGLTNPPFIDSTSTVREGNRRIVCLRKLRQKILNGQSDIPIWKIDPLLCWVLPDDTTESDVAIYLALEHVTGKKEWMAINQAAHVHDLSTVYKLSFEEIEKAIGLNKSLLSSASLTYQKTLEYHKAYPNDKDWLSKYSYFYELIKKPNLKDWSTQPNFNRVMKWINSGQITRGEEIRHLPEIASDQRMMKKVASGGTFKDALTIGMKLKIRTIEKGSTAQDDTLSIILNTGRVLHKIRTSNAQPSKKDRDRQIEAARKLNAELSIFLKSARRSKSEKVQKKMRKSNPKLKKS